MKKYLLAAVMAVAVTGAFVSCSDDVVSGSLIEQKAKAFENAYIEAYGTPAPNHTWGFKTNNIAEAEARGVTRTAKTESNLWYVDKPTGYGLQQPDPLFDEEIEYVMDWFSQVRQGHGEVLDVNNYFVQQVAYGNKYDQGVKYPVSGQVFETIRDGNPVYRTENYEVQSKEHMDWIAANMTANVQSEQDCDHVNNFNTGSGSLMYMQDSETKYGFAFKDSWGTVNNLVSTNYYMVHLVADYKGKHIDGWYVGFDYQTSKVEYNADGTLTSSVKLDPDGKYNDRVVKIIPAGGGTNPPTGEWKIEEIEEIVEAGRVFCEDLGASKLNDIDYNDVVFDAIIVHKYQKLTTTVKEDGKDPVVTESVVDNSSEYYAKICLLAAGGTVPASVAGYEVHDVLSNSSLGTNVMINTTRNKEDVNGAQIDECAPVIIQEAVEGQEETVDKKFMGITLIKDIEIAVQYGNAVTMLTAETGSTVPAAPYKFCVPIGTPWAKERVSIGEAYRAFPEYNQTGSGQFWEGKGVVATNLWDNCQTLFIDENGEYYKEGTILRKEVIDSGTGSGSNSNTNPSVSGSVLWTGSNALGNWDWNSRVELSKDKFSNITKDSKIRIDVTFSNNWQIKVRTIGAENLMIPMWNNSNTVQTGMAGVGNNYIEFTPGNDNYANMIRNDGLIIFGTNCTVTKVTLQ